jgi:uncharacterized protein YcbK (DUF882 family)
LITAKLMPDEIEWRWPHFTRAELECKCGCGEIVIVPEFLDRLERLREHLNRPMIVNSGYRCPEYNARVSNTGRDGPHTTGRAIDVRAAGGAALILVRVARMFQFTGVGVFQKGPHAKRFLHLDDLGSTRKRPRPWLWSY